MNSYIIYKIMDQVYWSVLTAKQKFGVRITLNNKFYYMDESTLSEIFDDNTSEPVCHCHYNKILDYVYTKLMRQVNSKVSHIKSPLKISLK